MKLQKKLIFGIIIVMLCSLLASCKEPVTEESLSPEPLDLNAQSYCAVTEDAGRNHRVVLLSDGTVFARGENQYGQCVTEKWSNIKSVAVGNRYTLGLKSDGTVLVAGTDWSQWHKEASENWVRIKDIYCRNGFIFGIKENGSVICGTENEFEPQILERLSPQNNLFFEGRCICSVEDGKVFRYYYNAVDPLPGELFKIDEDVSVADVWANSYRIYIKTEDDRIRINGADFFNGDNKNITVKIAK